MEVVVTDRFHCTLTMQYTEYSSTETQRLSGRLSWSSLETLKASFSVSNGDQGSHPDDISVSVRNINDKQYSEAQWVCFYHVEGLTQNCSNSIADELELLQSCTKLSIYLLFTINISLRNQTINNTSTIMTIMIHDLSGCCALSFKTTNS